MRHRPVLRRGRVALGLLAVLLGACAAPPHETPEAADPDRPSGDVVVFAAASLTDAVEEVAAVFTDDHPDVSVTFNVAGSHQLANQLVEGAHADVFASADAAQMDVAADHGLVDGQPQPLASNSLAIAVEQGNPLDVTGLPDLADPGVLVVMAAEQVPAGVYARAVLGAAGVSVSPASLESDVRAVVSKVALGEADAGLVYASDIVAAEARVDGVSIPDDVNVEVRYQVARLVSASNPAAAAVFVDFLRGPEGQAVLTEHGFTAP